MEKRRGMSLLEYCEVNNLDILKDWDYEANSLELYIAPSDVSYMSHKEVHWCCERGHKYLNEVYIRVRTKANGCPYCTSQQVLAGENDLASKYPHLAEEWDFENNDLKPTEVTAMSRKHANWKCKYGHTWNARISARALGNGCPHCSNWGTSFNEQAILYYANKFGLATESRPKINGAEMDVVLPDLNIAIEYDGSRYHSEFAFNSNGRTELDKRKICADAGLILYKVCGCTETAGVGDDYTLWYNDNNIRIRKYTDFTDVLIELFSRVSKNAGIDLLIDIDVQRDSTAIMAQYESYKEGNSFASVITGYLESQWDYEKNNGLTPSQLTKADNAYVWWKCNKGHSWNARMDSRLRNQDVCPYCDDREVLTGYNDLATTHPEIAFEWDFKKNKDITPQEVTCKSSKKIYWKCPKCKNSWYRSVGEKVKSGVCSNSSVHAQASFLNSHHSEL